jgi:hypothetical protein
MSLQSLRRISHRVAISPEVFYLLNIMSVLKSFGFWNILDFGFSARDVQVVKSMQIFQISKKVPKSETSLV